MTSRPKNAATSNLNRRATSIFDDNQMRAFGSMSNGNLDFQAVPLSMSYFNSGVGNGTTTLSEPPALPPRTDATRSRFSTYSSSMYNPYSRFSPSMLSYGGYRTPYSRYMPGMPHDSYNSFIQLAEESTRPAFESIESVVDIVSSISMMLESTYHAVYSSYHAILGVVEQFSRLRDHLSEVLSFLALLRGLKYLCLKILYLLRLRKDNPSVEAAWNTAKSVSDQSDFTQFRNDPKSPWPFFMFVGLVIGAPWLMFRLLARSVAKKPVDISSWKNEKGKYMTCQANYTFTTSRRGELPFTAGEYLYIAPKHFQTRTPKGWLLACNQNNKVGLVPGNYLKGQRTATGGFSVITHRKDSLTSEVTNPGTSKVDAIPEKSDELSKNIPCNPFVERVDSPVSEVTPIPSMSEESNVENEEQ